MHIFCHRTLPYKFIAEDKSDWMSRYFFSGGMMPSYDLPLHFQDRLKLAARWCWNGQHYEQTSTAWLANMDRRKAKIWPILAETYGAELAQVWWTRWRVFFMACADYPSGMVFTWMAPYWIIALWMAFATTFNLAFHWLHGRLLLAALFGAVGGPLAWWAGARLGALELVDPMPALTALSLGWMVMMPLLMKLAARFDGVSEPS